MHLLQIHDHLDRHLGDLDRRRDAQRHQLPDLNCDMDLKKMAHLHHLDAVQIHLDDLEHLHLLDVAHLDALQNLDVAHLDVAHLDALRPLVAVADVELRHQLRMDCCRDVADVELRHRLRMDCCQDVAASGHQVFVVLQMLD